MAAPPPIGVANAAFMYYHIVMQYGKFASIYDTLMSGVDYDLWASYVAGFIPRGSLVYECACGTGKISLRLAGMNYSIVASDISEDMLMVAASSQRESGLAGSRLRFVRMDMRELSFNKKADCVIACCDGVNYLTSDEDALAFFRSAHASLKPGGLLLFDVSSEYKLSAVLGNNCFIDNGREAAYMWQNTYDERSRLIRMDLAFFKKQDRLYERFDETHIQRAYSVDELKDMLLEAGFAPEAYRCFSREPVGEKDERIQFVAVRTEDHA